MYVLYRFIVFAPKPAKKQKKQSLGISPIFPIFQKPKLLQEKSIGRPCWRPDWDPKPHSKAKALPNSHDQIWKNQFLNFQAEVARGNVLSIVFCPLDSSDPRKTGHPCMKHQTAESKRHQTGPSKAVSHSNPRKAASYRQSPNQSKSWY